MKIADIKTFQLKYKLKYRIGKINKIRLLDIHVFRSDMNRFLLDQVYLGRIFFGFESIRVASFRYGTFC